MKPASKKRRTSIWSWLKEFWSIRSAEAAPVKKKSAPQKPVDKTTGTYTFKASELRPFLDSWNDEISSLLKSHSLNTGSIGVEEIIGEELHRWNLTITYLPNARHGQTARELTKARKLKGQTIVEHSISVSVGTVDKTTEEIARQLLHEMIHVVIMIDRDLPENGDHSKIYRDFERLWLIEPIAMKESGPKLIKLLTDISVVAGSATKRGEREDRTKTVFEELLQEKFAVTIASKLSGVPIPDNRKIAEAYFERFAAMMQSGGDRSHLFDVALLEAVIRFYNDWDKDAQAAQSKTKKSAIPKTTSPDAGAKTNAPRQPRAGGRQELRNSRSSSTRRVSNIDAGNRMGGAGPSLRRAIQPVLKKGKAPFAPATRKKGPFQPGSTSRHESVGIAKTGRMDPWEQRRLQRRREAAQKAAEILKMARVPNPVLRAKHAAARGPQPTKKAFYNKSVFTQKHAQQLNIKIIPMNQKPVIRHPVRHKTGAPRRQPFAPNTMPGSSRGPGYPVC